jgi:hypothetical protein
MVYRRYILKKDYTCEFGTLPVNSQIDTYGDRIMFNGGMIEPQYYTVLENLIVSDDLRNKYLREVVVPINKI